MLRKFFGWLEHGAYRAICQGCQRAVDDLSGGDVILDVKPITSLTDETEAVESLPEPEKVPEKKPVKKKRATRK